MFSCKVLKNFRLNIFLIKFSKDNYPSVKFACGNTGLNLKVPELKDTNKQWGWQCCSNWSVDKVFKPMCCVAGKGL